jgi:hypothetical protein
MSTEFDQALGEIRTYAKNQFEGALPTASRTPTPTPPPTAPAADREIAKQKQAEEAKAQGTLASAFAQLGDVDRTEQKAKGYVDVVALMHTTATTAAQVCLKIGALMTTAPSGSVTDDVVNARINALSGVLTALAQLSPASLWADPPAQSSDGGK